MVEGCGLGGGSIGLVDRGEDVIDVHGGMSAWIAWMGMNEVEIENRENQRNSAEKAEKDDASGCG